MSNHFDPEVALDRVRAARTHTPAAPGREVERIDEGPTGLADLGARMFGHPYKGDPLAEINHRMFRI